MKGTRKSGLGRSLLSSGIGPFLSQMLALALAPVLFRLYTPQHFGIWAAVQAMAIISGSLVSLRFDLALVLERNLLAASKLFYAIIGVIIASSTLAGLLIGISIGFLRSLGIDSMTAFLGWSWLVSIGFGVVLQGWLMREAAFRAISFAVVLNATVTNLVQLTCGIWGHGIWLIIGSVAGQAAALVFYIVRIASDAEQRPVWRPLTLFEVGALLKQHRRFPLLSLPFTALSLLRDRVPIFIIGAFGPPALVGLYSQAWRFTHFPSGMTSAALRPVFFHRTATEGLAAQGHAVDRFVRWLLLASSPWVALVVFGKDALFTFLFGGQWHGAGILAAMLVLPGALFAITNWMDRLLDAVGRQDVNLKVEFVAALSSVGVLWVVRAWGGSLTMAVLLQSGALVLCYVGFIWICYGIAGWSRSGLMMSVCAACAIGGLMYVCMTILELALSQAGVFLVGATLAALTTIATLVMVRRELP